MADKAETDEMLGDLVILLENFDKLEPIVGSTQCVGVGLYGLSQRMASKLGADGSKVFQIIVALSRFKRACDANEKSADQMVEWISTVINDEAPPEWKQKFLAAWESSSSRIAKLIDSIGSDHPIMIALKAQQLVYSHQNIFLGSRLVTDVRPVFSDDGSNVDELVVTHVLNINYTDGTQNKTVLSIALDQDDVATLQRQCERAATKVLTLKQTLKDFPLVVMPDLGGA